MNIDRSTALSFILTILIILLISILINYFLNCTIKEGLKSFGEADTSFNGPLPYETTMNQIKYPNHHHYQILKRKKIKLSYKKRK